MERASLIAKISRVINSCNTLDQLMNAKTYADLAYDALNVNHTGFLFGDMDLFFAIRNDLNNRKRQILNLPHIPQPLSSN